MDRVCNQSHSGTDILHLKVILHLPARFATNSPFRNLQQEYSIARRGTTFQQQYQRAVGLGGSNQIQYFCLASDQICLYFRNKYRFPHVCLTKHCSYNSKKCTPWERMTSPAIFRIYAITLWLHPGPAQAVTDEPKDPSRTTIDETFCLEPKWRTNRD